MAVGKWRWGMVGSVVGRVGKVGRGAHMYMYMCMYVDVGMRGSATHAWRRRQRTRRVARPARIGGHMHMHMDMHMSMYMEG